VAPHAYTESRRLTQRAALEDPSSLFTPGVPITAIPGYLIYAEKRTGKVLENVQLFSLSGERADITRSRPGSVTVARRAELDDRELRARRALGLSMDGAFVVSRRWPRTLSDEDRASMKPGEIEALELRAEEAMRQVPDVSDVQTGSSPISVPLTRLFERSERIRVDGIAMKDLWLGIRDPGGLAARLGVAVIPSRTEILTEFNRRLSFSLACLVLALVGIPFGITAQRRETSSGFVLSLVVGISYFTLIMLGELWKDKADKLPFLWVWLPNVVFGGLGLLMFYRLQRR
jgi:lipopolysaccharide export system permease protein